MKERALKIQILLILGVIMWTVAVHLDSDPWPDIYFGDDSPNAMGVVC